VTAARAANAIGPDVLDDNAMAARSVEPDPTEERSLAHAALAAAGDLAYAWALDDDRIEWVGDIADIFGRNASPPVTDGEGFNERINAEDLARRLKILNEHISTGAPYDCEYRIRRDDGSFIWVHDRGQAEIMDGGAPARLTGTLRVITNRKQAQSLLEHRAN